MEPARYGYTDNNVIKAANGGFDLQDDSGQITAAPYYFSITRPRTNVLRYNWTVNNKVTTPTNNNQNILDIAPIEESGVAKIGLSIENPQKFIQFTNEQTILVDF